MAVGYVYFILHQRGEKQVPFSMAIGNDELMHECFVKYSPMATANKVRRVEWIWKAGARKWCTEGLSIAWAYSLPGSLIGEAVYELPS